MSSHFVFHCSCYVPCSPLWVDSSSLTHEGIWVPPSSFLTAALQASFCFSFLLFLLGWPPRWVWDRTPPGVLAGDLGMFLKRWMMDKVLGISFADSPSRLGQKSNQSLQTDQPHSLGDMTVWWLYTSHSFLGGFSCYNRAHLQKYRRCYKHKCVKEIKPNNNCGKLGEILNGFFKEQFKCS